MKTQKSYNSVSPCQDLSAWSNISLYGQETTLDIITPEIAPLG